MPGRDPASLFARACGGDRTSLARLLTLVERGGEPARVVAGLAHAAAGRAHVVGLTGAPGAGKSTLTDALLGHLRSSGLRVAVLAVDPTSPFTGGAILGDRLRMTRHSGDDGAYVRSMATRGHLGGLTLAAPEAVRVLDAVGFDVVVVETVGVGQAEVEVAGHADTTVVVLNPGWGDAVQANKAGLMEVADVFCVNKADRPGAEATVREVESALDLGGAGSSAGSWRPPVVRTSAVDGTGVPALWSAISDHLAAATASGALELRRRQRMADELRSVLARRLAERAASLTRGPGFERLVAEVAARRLDPWAAADRVLGAAERR